MKADQKGQDGSVKLDFQGQIGNGKVRQGILDKVEFVFSILTL